MNVNFLLAGVPNPSTFYIVMQVVLLLTHAGAFLGLDAWLAKTLRHPLLVAQPLVERRRRRRQAPVRAIGVISFIVAIYALTHVTDWSPAGSVDDSAMIVAILALLGLAWAAIAWLRQDASGWGVLRHRAALPTISQEPEAQSPAAVPRLREVGTAIAGLPRAPTRTTRSPQRPRRLALTVTLAWSDDDDQDEPHSDHCADETPRTALPKGMRHVPAGQQLSPALFT
jgi:hypothetical protein